MYFKYLFGTRIWRSNKYSLLHLECFIQYEFPDSISLVDFQQKVAKETYETRTYCIWSVISSISNLIRWQKRLLFHMKQDDVLVSYETRTSNERDSCFIWKREKKFMRDPHIRDVCIKKTIRDQIHVFDTWANDVLVSYETRTSNEIWDWRNDTPNAICCIGYMYCMSFMTCTVCIWKKAEMSGETCKRLNYLIKDLHVQKHIFTKKNTYRRSTYLIRDLYMTRHLYSTTDYIPKTRKCHEGPTTQRLMCLIKDLLVERRLYSKKEIYIRKKTPIFKKKDTYNRPDQRSMYETTPIFTKRRLYSKKDGHQRDMNTCQLGKSSADYCNNKILQHTASATHCNTHCKTLQ